MRERLAVVALTLSSALTIFLGLTYVGLLNGLFAEHGGDRAAGVFFVCGPLILCGCYLFWKWIGGGITRPTKLFALTPLVGFILSLIVGATLWPFFICAWFILLGWQYLQQWRLYGTWRALFIQKNPPV